MANKKKPKQQVEYRALSEIKPLDNNPRYIKTDDFERLCASVQNNADYFECRPIILSDRTGELVIIAGNQRYKAAQEVGLKEVPTILLHGLTEAKEKEIVIRDNVQNGKWDYDILASGAWGEVEELTDWGVEMNFLADTDDFGGNEKEPEGQKDETVYSRSIEAPIYQITGSQPDESECVDFSKVNKLIEEIDNSNISNKQKEMLRICAYRHAVINFANMAEYYAHQDKEMQNLMENNALVVVDFDKAIENGFIDMTEKLLKIIPDGNQGTDEIYDDEE